MPQNKGRLSRPLNDKTKCGQINRTFYYFNKYARNCAKSSSISSESNGTLLCLSNASGNGRSSEEYALQTL